MIVAKHTIETPATPQSIWQIWQDVPNWKTWDHGLEYSTLEGPFAVGSQGFLKPKGGPQVRTQLTRVEYPTLFVDEAKLFLGQIIVAHTAVRQGDKTAVTHSIEMKGPLALFYAWVIGRNMRKNLAKEMQSMVAQAEALG